jgi:hypothetical protein
MHTLVHEYDPDLRLALAPPSGDTFASAFAEWFDGRGAGREYFADLELVRACTVEPKGEAFSALVAQWSGLPMAAWPYCVDMASCGDHVLLDPRVLLDGSEASAAHLAAMAEQGIGVRAKDHTGPLSADMARETLASWLRSYPRKGPLGKAQLVVLRFAWGYAVVRAPEPQEWFDVEEQRRKGQHYEVARRFVKACTLAPSVPDLLARNRQTPALVTVLGGIIREAAGESLVKRVGESFGA